MVLLGILFQACFYFIRGCTYFRFRVLLVLLNFFWLLLRHPISTFDRTVKYDFIPTVLSCFLLFLTRRILAQACWVTRDGTSQYYFKLFSTLSKVAHTSAFEFYLCCCFFLALAAASAFLLNTTPSHMVLLQLCCHAWFFERLNLWCVARFFIRFAIVTSVTVFFSAAHRPFVAYFRVRFHSFSSSLGPKRVVRRSLYAHIYVGVFGSFYFCATQVHCSLP